MRVLVTGASGFVGRALCASLAAAGHEVVPAVRAARGLPGERVVGEIGAHTDWRAALSGIEAVVHLAARVHVMYDTAADPLEAFRAVNVAGTLQLARQCAAAGVRRFVFVSSIKVNGEGRAAPYRESDSPAPEDAYARSKWEAEEGLRAIESAGALEVVVLRPPLIYGPGVGANFQRLMRSVRAGWPLPLGSIANRRSLLYVGNFADLIVCALTHPAAAGKTFLVADGEDLSSPELIRRLARAMDRRARLLSVPAGLLWIAGRLIGRSAEMDRLLGSFAIDTAFVREQLGWRAPHTVDAGLRETANDFLRHTVRAAP